MSSTLTLTVQMDSPTDHDGTTLECYIGQLSLDSVSVVINASGKTTILLVHIAWIWPSGANVKLRQANIFHVPNNMHFDVIH